MIDGTLIFDTEIDNKGFTKGANTIKKQGIALTNSFSKLGKILAGVFTITALVQFSKKAIDVASDIQEVQNVVDTAFGDMAYKMEQFAENSIEAFGMSKLSAKQTGSTFMAMASGMNIASESASDMSIQLTALAGDMASFYNKTTDITSTALKSIFTGETETLKQFGIVMTETNLETFRMNQGIKTAYKNMTQAQKVQLRYNYVMEQTKLAQGDFLKTQGSWANQTRILSENFKELMSVLGSGLVKALTPAIQVVNMFVKKLIELANSIAKVFGGRQVEVQNEQTEAVKGTTKAEKKLEDQIKDTTKANNKALAGFDTIMKLSEKTAEASGGGAGAGELPISTPYDLSTLTSGSKEIGMLEDVDFSKLINSLNRLRDALSRFGNNIFNGLKWGYDNVIKPLGEFIITEALPRFFDTLANSLDIFNEALEKIAPIFADWYTNYIRPLAEFTADKFLEFWDKLNEKLKGAKEWLSDTTIFEDLRTIFTKLQEIMKPLIEDLITFIEWIGEIALDTASIEVKWFFEDLEDVIGAIADLIRGDFDSAWQHLRELLIDNRIDKAKEKFENIKSKIVEVADAIKSNFTKEKMDEAFFNIGQSFGNAVKSMLEKKQDIEDFINNSIKPLFTKEKWLEIFNGLKDAMFSTIENIKSWFTLDKWKEMGGNLYNGLAGGINNAIDGIQNLVNTAIDFFNSIIDGYNSIAEEVPFMSTIDNISTVDFSKYKLKVPKLANGTVVPANNGEFLAMLGDNKKETEVVSPLSTIKQAIKEVMSEMGQQNLTATVPVYWNGEKIYEQIEKVKARRGSRLVRGGI